MFPASSLGAGPPAVFPARYWIPYACKRVPYWSPMSDTHTVEDIAALTI